MHCVSPFYGFVSIRLILINLIKKLNLIWVILFRVNGMHSDVQRSLKNNRDALVTLTPHMNLL